MKQRTVGLFETEAELSALLEWGNQASADLLLIALSAEADYAAEHAKLDYKTIEEFYDENELIQRGIQEYGRVQRLCDLLDSHIRECLSTHPLRDTFSTNYFFYHLKILVDTILSRVFPLSAAIDVLDPDKVISFATKSESIQNDLFFRRESLVSSIVSLLAQRFGYRVVQLPPILEGKGTSKAFLEPGTLRQRIVQLLACVPGANAVIRKLRQQPMDTVASVLNTPPRPVLILADRYSDTEIVADHWFRRNVGSVLHLHQLLRHTNMTQRRVSDKERFGLRETLSVVLQKILQDSSFAALFSFDEVNFFPIFERRLRHLLLSVVPNCLEMAALLSVVLRGIPNALVLGSLFVSVEQIACAVAARNLKIPVCCGQHGGLIGYADYPMAEHFSLYVSDCYLCYGEGVHTFLMQPSPSGHRSIVKRRAISMPAVGSASLDCITTRRSHNSGATRNHLRLPESKPIVVYVATNLNRDVRYFSYHLYPDIWYWRLQREVIRLCSQFSDVFLLAKFHPDNRARNPVDIWARHEGIDNCRIIRDVPFRDVLDLADLFIIDAPTTTLLQTLTTNKKAVVFSGGSFMRFDPEAAELLKRRVIFSETRERFLQDIEATLRKHDWTLPQPPNGEFLRAYGTHLDDGRSAERAVDVLHAIASGDRLPDFGLAGSSGSDM